MKEYNSSGILDGVKVSHEAHQHFLESGEPRYVGIWHGGAGYGAPDWHQDAELFDSIEHAKLVLLGRYHNSSRWYETPFKLTWALDGSMYSIDTVQQLDTPCVSEGSSITLAPFGTLRDELESGYYSHELSVGPRGGVQVRRG